MSRTFDLELLRSLDADSLEEIETIQQLWSGYGTIKRYRVVCGDVESVIVKHVCPPSDVDHPRGWNSDFSHQRKLESYRVESTWYRELSRRCESGCRVPACYALESEGSEFHLALEDLDASGFPRRRQSVTDSELKACISWLAHFHATFMGLIPEGLWEVGTYWHLDTRPDELEQMPDSSLRRAAGAIDRLLRNARHQTIVHGDAKIANFCFSTDGEEVAAVDFQYVGGGCGMKDLAYFLGSCLSGEECEKLEEALLDFYFTQLRTALERRESQLDFDDLEQEWRSLYAPAWADFSRFLTGWSPGHWKLNSYEKKLTREVIESLAQND